MILVDTSVWIDHLHATVAPLVAALEQGDVLTHPFIIGELACGRIRRRGEVLSLLSALPMALVASDEEALRLIDEERLMGSGLGYIDVHLLAAVRLTGDTRLWTRDRRLGAIAVRMQVS